MRYGYLGARVAITDNDGQYRVTRERSKFPCGRRRNRRPGKTGSGLRSRRKDYRLAAAETGAAIPLAWQDRQPPGTRQVREAFRVLR